jgi:flagellar motor switch protein FliN
VAEDDLLDPSEIEALLKAAGGGGAATPPGAAPVNPAPADPGGGSGGLDQGAPDDMLSTGDIEALLKQRDGGLLGGGGFPAPGGFGGVEDSLQRAEQGVAAALAPERPAPRPAASRPTAAAPARRSVPGVDQARNFDFQAFDAAAAGVGELEMQAIREVELDLRIELGRAELLIEEVLQLREGSVVPLDKLAGDPVDIMVNGRLIARGEVLVLNDNFCVRVAEIIAPAA